MASYKSLNSSGGNIPANSTFTEDVFKFDASSFYNYEQDNLPVIDLENRTDLLNSILGYPTSSVTTGVTFVLSGSIGGSIDVAHKNNIYTSLDDIVGRIPRYLTFPVLIELCSYGNLGEFNLANITCAKGGKIEIVNRNFGVDPSASYHQSINVSAARGYSTQHIHTMSSITLSSLIGAAASTKTGDNCYAETSWNTNAIAFAVKATNGESETDRLTVHKAETGLNNFCSGTNVYELSAYSYYDDNTISSLDPLNTSGSTTNSDLSLDRTRLPGGLVQYNTSLNASNNGYFFAAYGNFFSSVNIRGCTGSVIKFTNICVDGGVGNDRVTGSLVHTTENGFNIIDSEVILENSAAIRCSKAGFLFKNSTIGITGSMFGYRNYALESGSRGAEGDGLKSINSEINFDEYSSTIGTEFPNSSRYPIAFSKNGNGIQLVNSTLRGGILNQDAGIVPNAGYSDLKTTTIQAYQNSSAGIKAKSSEIEFKGRLDLFDNDIGLHGINSEFHVSQFSIDDNGSIGIKLDNTVFEYGYLCDSWDTPADSAKTTNPYTPKKAYFVTNNGQNVVAVRNSSLFPYRINHMPEKHGMWGGHGAGESSGNTFGVLNSIDLSALPMAHHGETHNLDKNNLPGIFVKDNSVAEFIHLDYECYVDPNIVGVRGKVAAAHNNSKIIFRGTNRSTTVMGLSINGNADTVFTANPLASSWLTTATYASNNSKIEFTGPTKISKFGIAALAENSSEISFNPPFIEGGDRIIDSSGYDLSNTANHTVCQLHATRSILVANNKSGIKFFGLGGSALDAAVTMDKFTLDSYAGSANYLRDTASGSMKFYPNGFTSALGGASQLNTGPNALTRTGTLGTQQNRSTGGMCVRAVGGSYVDVYNVNFLMEAAVASGLSGAFYNYNGSGQEYYPDAIVNVDAGEPLGKLGSYLIDSGGGEPGGTPVTYVDSLERPSGGNAYQGTTLGTTMNATMGGSPGDVSAWGSRIYIWNIADNSRIQSTNCLINGVSPWTECQRQKFHGPGGKWLNGAALDYYGLGGAVATYGQLSGVSGTDANGDAAAVNDATARKYSFKNLGIFRLMSSVRGDLKSYFEVSSASGSFSRFGNMNSKGGSFMDQVNAQGYQTVNQDVSTLPDSDFRRHVGAEGGASSIRNLHTAEEAFGLGYAAPDLSSPGFIQQIGVASYVWDHTTSTIVSSISYPGVPIPPLHCDWQGYLRNWLDESSSHVFANAMHGANKKVNLVSIFRSTTEGARGGEGRDGTAATRSFGVGVKSLNMFDLDSLA